MFSVDEVVKATLDVPPLSPSSTQLAGLVSQPDVDVNDVVETIQLDPGLTGSVIRAANSASIGGSRKIGLVRDAVVRLGMGTTLSLAIASQVRGTMQQTLPQFELERGMLWEHSVAAALTAELIRPKCSGPVPPEAFTAALLHDLGKIVLVDHLDPEVSDWLRRARKEGHEAGHRAEIEILGCHHGEIGEIVARNWRLPETVCKAIAYHHDPSGLPAPATDLVHVADFVAKAIGTGSKRDVDEAEIDAGAAERLGLSAETIAAIGEQAARRLDDVLSSYDL